MREHRDDNHTDAAAEACFADTGEPCAEAENNDFSDGDASFYSKVSTPLTPLIRGESGPNPPNPPYQGGIWSNPPNPPYQGESAPSISSNPL